MTTAAVIPALLILFPCGVVLGWIARTLAGRADAAHAAPRPLWSPELEPRRAAVRSERLRPEPLAVVNIHLTTLSTPGSPQLPPVVLHGTVVPELPEGSAS